MAALELLHRDIKKKNITCEKLQLISLLLEIDLDVVEKIYNNIPNNYFIEEQVKLSKLYEIDVNVTFSVLAIISRL